MTTLNQAEVQISASRIAGVSMKRRSVIATIALIVCGALIGVVVSGAWRSRGGNSPAIRAVSPPRASGQPLEAALLERLGVRFAPVARGGSDVTVHVLGVLELNRQRLAEVSTYAAGRATVVRAVIGQRVRRGDVLALIESPAIGEAAAHFQVREAELRTARQHLARLRDLAAQELTTRRELELAEAQARAAEAELEAARTRLQALGITPGGFDGRAGHAPLVSPIDGVVIRREILLGSWVQPEAEAFAIADLSNLWAELDVYEGELGLISVGDPVQLGVGALGLRELHGEVELIYAELDRATRMGKIRVAVPNPEGRLHAGLSVAAHIRPRGRSTALTVPADSVRIREGRHQVLMRRGATAVWVPVDTGASHGSVVEINHGLAEGDLIAVSGVGLLGNEL